MFFIKELIFSKGVFESQVFRCRASVFLFFLMFLPNLVYSQEDASNVSDNLTPIVSFLLQSSDGQCPAISTATTVVGDQSISNQSDIDDLLGVTRVVGNIDVSNVSSSTLDFSPLDSLVEVTATIGFNQTLLTSIDGFGCLSVIGGGLFVGSNGALINLPSFDSLTSIAQDVNISGNPMLSSLPTFSSLSSLGGSLAVGTNALLVNAPDFEALISVGMEINFTGNPLLTSLPQFPVLTTIGTNIGIGSNSALEAISGFPLLNSLGGFVNIAGHSNLDDISGFQSLSSIGGDLIIGGNSGLMSISGFAVLESNDVVGQIIINANQQLDCANPVPNFVPVADSRENSVNCLN